jgi:carboxymethylenebutenolidase
MAETIELAVGGIRTDAFTAIPKGPGPFPGVVVTFHREGLEDFTEWKVDHLAQAGFAAIAPGHYHVLPEGVDFTGRHDYLTDEQMAADIKAAADWLADRDDVDGSRLAVIGPCMGGRTALVALECNPELWTCGCVWYGGEVFEPLVGRLPAPGARERLDRITCPIAGFFGNLDTHPAPEEVDRLDALLTELGKDHAFYRYDTAGHGFLNPWHPRYHPEAAKDSWARAMAFLHEHLDAQ